MKTIVHIKVKSVALTQEQREQIKQSLTPHFDPEKVLILITNNGIEVSVHPHLIHWIKSLPIKIKLTIIMKWKQLMHWWKQDYRIVEWSTDRFEIEYRAFGIWYVHSLPNGSIDGMSWDEPMRFTTKEDARQYIDEVLRGKKKVIHSEL